MSKKIIVFTLLALLFLPVAAGAITENDLWGGQQANVSGALGLSQNADVRVTIANLINVALGLLGIVCVVIVIAGGVVWMTSGGEEAKTKKAKGLIFAGVIGLAIILSAYAISNFVITSLVTAVK